MLESMQSRSPVEELLGHLGLPWSMHRADFEVQAKSLGIRLERPLQLLGWVAWSDVLRMLN